MSENNQTYTVEEIKQAFWKTFHRTGEIFFNYLGNERQCNDSTFGEWMEFHSALTGKLPNNNEGDK